MAGALIVTSELGMADFAWLDGLRWTYYPAERNRLPAHLTMFHALPPSSETEVRSRLSGLAKEAPPVASIEGIMNLGGGTALRVVSPDLDRIRNQLADDLRGLLGAQDSGGWRPHVTIQNKVAPKVARELVRKLERDFRPRPLAISGLALHRYLDGPWERISSYPFRGR
jgi:hypothetical protein